jgi:hypothetical protein
MSVRDDGCARAVLAPQRLRRPAVSGRSPLSALAASTSLITAHRRRESRVLRRTVAALVIKIAADG